MAGNQDRGRPHVVVVGAGIAGLTAAWELTRRAGDDIRVTLLEGSPRIGGKLRVSDVGGVPVDEGAESMLARRPEGVGLVHELGLGEQLVEPGTTSASIWVDGALWPIPRGHVMGVPADLDAFAMGGLFPADLLARVREQERRPAPGIEDDVAIGRYVAGQLGEEIVDRLVEPLLGGVYAGRADLLSLRATLPQLAPELRVDGSLLAAARRVAARTPVGGGPVFATLRGGMGRLPALLAERSSAEIRTSVMVRALRALRGRPGGWSLTLGPTREPERLDADAVILAVPARPASRLLAEVAPAAAADLGSIEYASIALVTLAYPESAFGDGGPPGSGFLVPASARRLTKAATFVSAKWPHVHADGLVLVRCSVGRHGEEHSLQVPDEVLVKQVTGELAEAVGVTGPPVETRVTRWGGALPQYLVGHLEKVARIKTGVAGLAGLAVCGAAYQGVGVPACVASAREAVDRVVAALPNA